MKKRNLKQISLALVLVMALGMLLSACGGSASSSGKYEYASTPAAAPAPASNSFVAMDDGWYTADMAMEAPKEAESWNEESGGGRIDSIKTETLDKANVKLIYRASMSVQTREFEETQAAIRQLVDGMGGWFENAETYYGSYYGNNLRNAYFTVRVPAAKYSEFLAAVGNSCHITNLSQNVEDVSLAYSDIETRLATLQTKHERLLDLLSKATEMTDIIDLENALSDCEYQIDSYTQSKNRYDSLIGYSTVNIDISEVAELADSVVEDQSFGARLGRTLKRGVSNFLDGLDDFVMWVSYHLIGLIIFAVLVVIAVKLIRSHNDPEKVAARQAKRAEKLEAKRAKAAEKRGGASPFKTEQQNADLTGNKIEVSDDK